MYKYYQNDLIFPDINISYKLRVNKAVEISNRIYTLFSKAEFKVQK